MLDFTVEALCGVGLTCAENEPRECLAVVVDNGSSLLPVDNWVFVAVVFEGG